MRLNGSVDNFSQILYFSALFFTLLVFTQFRTHVAFLVPVQPVSIFQTLPLHYKARFQFRNPLRDHKTSWLETY